MRWIRAGALTIGVLLPVACSTPSVTWSEVSYPGSARIERASPAVVTEPVDACPGSFRTSAAGPDIYAAWWRVRPDSSSVLMAGRSTDGGRSWGIVTPADTLDRSHRGCDRPPPSVFADSGTLYVDFAYFLESKEGAGIFFTHTMDGPHMGTGEGIFHSPVAIVYGDRPSRVSVAAEGDNVAVAYEDPNAGRPAVAIALSRTMGHIFEIRSSVSGRDLPAVDPLVSLSGHTVLVQWSEREDSVASGGRIALRQGAW